MGLFAEILTTVTLPIIMLMALGWFVQTRLRFDLSTLTRLLVNVVLPCALLHFLTTAELPLVDIWPTFWFTLLQFALLMGIGWGAAALCRLPEDYRPVIGLAAAFANSGNFGIPVAQLAFPADFLLHQTVIVSLHSVLIVPAGVLILAGRRGGLGDAMKALLTSPMIIAVAAGLAIKALEVELPFVLAHPIKIVAGGYISIALFTLGAQLAETQFSLTQGAAWLAVGLKMLLAPALSWVLLWIAGIAPELTDLLVVAAAAPVGILLGIFCSEYKRAPELASAAILVSTVLSPFFVTGWILAVRLY